MTLHFWLKQRVRWRPRGKKVSLRRQGRVCEGNSWESCNGRRQALGKGRASRRGTWVERHVYRTYFMMTLRLLKLLSETGLSAAFQSHRWTFIFVVYYILTRTIMFASWEQKLTFKFHLTHGKYEASNFVQQEWHSAKCWPLSMLNCFKSKKKKKKRQNCHFLVHWG